MFYVTTEEIKGYTIKKVLGIVKGSSVRAKWIGADISAGIKNLFGGRASHRQNAKGCRTVRSKCYSNCKVYDFTDRPTSC